LTALREALSTTPSNPLRDLHEQTGAEFQPYADVEIVSTFGNTPAEYSAIHKDAGKMDLPQRSVLELSGRDRLDFLNRLLTNQTFDKQTKTPMAAGNGVRSFLLNIKGRILADMNVLELGDRTWLEMDARLIESTKASLEKYLIVDDVTLTNHTGSIHEFALVGPKAAEALALPEMKTLQSTKKTLAGTEVVVFRDDVCGSPGYFLLVPAQSAQAVWAALPLLRPIGWAAFNAARIEAGRPLMGIDFDDTVLPAETGAATFASAVSVTKGCYLGQEIVARMHARSIVARQLVGIRMEADALPVAGSPIYDDAANIVGGVTSSTVSPILSNASICLAFVKKNFIEPGTQVTIPAEGAMAKGKVVGLPFIQRRETRDER
jgi:folate-binding protein YgfZ